MAARTRCPEAGCSFRAKSPAGLATHRRAKHPADDPKVGDVSSAVASGGRREVLVAMQRRLARALDEAEGRELLDITKQMLAITEAIDRGDGRDHADAATEANVVDEIANRRADRRAAAQH